MIRRVQIVIRGAVQGVGFRPFIYRLATELGLTGWVRNSPQGVFLEAEGDTTSVETFYLRIEREKPPRSFIQSMECSHLDPKGSTAFTIRESELGGDTSALVLPDIAICPDCLAEIFDPEDRRYLYPFTNCTNCGPRYSIIESLPYDRPNTSMRQFTMCRSCREEYANPLDRRFHAQPNACPSCGPHLELWDARGTSIASRHEALLESARMIRTGGIVALKGLGGFHLIADARNEEAVKGLRKRKHREEKPFAVMAPSLEAAQALCTISAMEERLLRSPEAPIVLLQRKESASSLHEIAGAVAPENPCLGVMLPYTPLHQILMHELGFPVVATSGNLSDEPICTDEQEALATLGRIADAFLVHNRPIVRHADDSIARIILGRELVLRRARGLAPLPITLPVAARPMLAVGAHLKNAVAVTKGSDVFLSQHIGDLETNQAYEAFQRAIGNLRTLFRVVPETVVSDMHPDYLSSQFARRISGRQQTIQHHYAHVASCMAENHLGGAVLGVSWDGTGYGTDGTIWGGEFLLTTESSFSRVATFRPFRLPGGERAIKEPRRAAIGALYELLGDAMFSREDLLPLKAFPISMLAVLRQMLAGGVRSPLTTSVGRLFDALASIIGLRQLNAFEGQSAMMVEFAAMRTPSEEQYGFTLETPQSVISIDWRPIVAEALEDLRRQTAPGIIAAKFHNTLSEIIVAVARRVNVPRVVLTGGCFQNRYLTERSVRKLEAGGFRAYWHQRVPPNDGGIALGQVYAAVRSTNRDADSEGTGRPMANLVTMGELIREETHESDHG